MPRVFTTKICQVCKAEFVQREELPRTDFCRDCSNAIRLREDAKWQ